MVNIKVGDRIRAERPDVAAEGVVTALDPGILVLGDWMRIAYGHGWTITVLERAPIPEPKGLGAVVQFDHPVAGRVRAVRNDDYLSAPWRSASDGWWRWAAISGDGTNIEILSEGVGVE